MTADFSGFVGIDWSGARGPRQPGIQLAEAAPGTAAPHTIMAEDGRHWGREPVLDWLIRRTAAADASAAGPVLVGIDFAFAHPFVDEGAFYPGLNGAPHYRSRRRATELAARASARAPSPTFKAIGADNVATGSMAGMRLIHALKAALGPRLAVWPFDRVATGQLSQLAMVLVEIFPSYYFHLAGINPAKNAAADPAFMSAALAGYDSAGVGPDFAPRGSDADEADAIVSAAALRWFVGQAGCWDAPDAAAHEGWIFGVPAVT